MVKQGFCMVGTASKKAIIFDLDGTAIPSRVDGMPSENLSQAITRASDTAYFSAATGRSWRHAKEPIRALGLVAPCVISGGTQIVDPITEKIKWEVIIPYNIVRLINSIARQYDKRVAYVTGLDVTDSVLPTESVDLLHINTIYMFDITAEQLHGIVGDIQETGEVNAAPTHSWIRPDVIDLHITHRDATKEYAVNKLCEYLGISKMNAIGIGDGHNDIHLFNAVGTKIAMGNAEDTLKKSADHIIDTIDNDGLATFINDYAMRNYEFN